jgi:hypothetical protein
VCVGFGIGRPDQVAAVGRVADGVAVGSAIVRLLEERAGSTTLVTDIGDFIASLKAPLRGLSPGEPVSKSRPGTARRRSSGGSAAAKDGGRLRRGA